MVTVGLCCMKQLCLPVQGPKFSGAVAGGANRRGKQEAPHSSAGSRAFFSQNFLPIFRPISLKQSRRSRAPAQWHVTDYWPLGNVSDDGSRYAKANSTFSIHSGSDPLGFLVHSGMRARASGPLE